AAPRQGAEERGDRDDRLRPRRPVPDYRRVPGLMTPILAFDIETVPDVEGIRKIHNLPADLPDHEVAEVAFQKRRVQTGSDFLPSHLQKVVVITCVLRNEQGLKVFSIGEP